MSMVTSCPSCNTTFRVTPQQLQLRHGQVRCGRCASVFDGFKGLATLPDQAPAEPPAPTASASAAPQAPPVPAAPVGPVGPVPIAAPEIAESAPPEPASGSFDFTAAPSSPLDRAEPVPLKSRHFEAITSASPPTASGRRTALWAAGSILLLLLLLAQGAYSYRSELAAQVPELRPHLQRMCGLLDCTLSHPQRPELLTIEGSDLQAADPARPGLIVLSATMRNRAPTTVAYPALELTLTNAQDQTVARRVFMPAEYLDKAADPRAGIASNAELGIRLALDTTDLQASGYRLFLFYP
jgi:predicted Zn finger-like uncharacterized protein